MRKPFVLCERREETTTTTTKAKQKFFYWKQMGHINYTFRRTQSRPTCLYPKNCSAKFLPGVQGLFRHSCPVLFLFFPSVPGLGIVKGMGERRGGGFLISWGTPSCRQSICKRKSLGGDVLLTTPQRTGAGEGGW